jgi:hypothetical protein
MVSRALKRIFETHSASTVFRSKGTVMLTIARLKRFSIAYYNDTAEQAKQATMERQKANVGLGSTTQKATLVHQRGWSLATPRASLRQQD